jgi:hypothetical protein
MRLLLVAISAVLLSASFTPALAQTDPRDAKARAEGTFREAVSKFAYGEYWALWDMACPFERFRLRQEDFAAAINRGRYRINGGNVAELWTSVHDPEYVTIHARIDIEDRLTRMNYRLPRTFRMKYEENRWCIVLNEFVGLASHGN